MILGTLRQLFQQLSQRVSNAGWVWICGCGCGSARSAGAWGMLFLGAFLGSGISPVVLEGFALPIFHFSTCLGWFCFAWFAAVLAL